MRAVYFLFLLFFNVSLAFSAVPMITGGYTIQGGGFYADTGQGVCNYWGQSLANSAAAANGMGPWSFTAVDAGNGLCNIDTSGPNMFGGTGSGSYQRNYYPAGARCPSNSTQSGNSCICNSGFNENNGQCIAPTPCDGLANFCTSVKGPGGFWNFEGKVNVSDTLCLPSPDHASCSKGCSADPAGMGVAYQKSDGSWHTGQELNFPGSVCDNAMMPQEKPVVSPSNCAGDWGNVNGVDVCLPSKAAEGDKKKTEEKNPDGSSTETNTSTKCENGKCTTTSTTTGKDSQGNPTGGVGSSSTTESEVDYCAKNPKSSVCAALYGGKNPSGNDEGKEEKEKSAFGGACGSFSCDGDAIQCAMAREQHERNCKLFDSESDPTFAKALDGTDGKNANAMKSDAQQVNIGNFDQSGLGWGSGCPADPLIPLNFGGEYSEFSIPFSRICGPLNILSLAGVGITLLGSLVWVLGGRNNRG